MTSTRPSSPDTHIEGVSLVYPNTGSSTPYFLQPLADNRPDMTKEKGSRLDVTLASDCVFLKGTGVDIEPTLLTGQVALTLTEPTSLKEVTLQFRGKARLPVPASESLNTSLTYTVCNHDWSFLEGDKRHTRTLKEGRHVFPFQLRIGGSLPSSIDTPEFGGASVTYRLRAQATRPGLSHNMQATIPVYIIRSMSPEALEYQQTLEIENTWPEKLMYSLMLPHKAWAVGDTITAMVKFSPLNKGTSVIDVTSSLLETTSVYSRSGSQDHTRVVANTKHIIVKGKAIASDGELNSATGSSGITSGSGSSYGLESSQARGNTTVPEDVIRDNNDVVTTLTLPIPLTATPTHGVEPIVVSHRARWNIRILNPNGHNSELRCSLPIHILDARLLGEARRHTAATRRLLLGGPEIPSPEGDVDLELPSYTSHVRDRVASMELPDINSAGLSHTETNSSGGTPLTPDANLTLQHNGHRSGYSSPLEQNSFSHLPHAPGSGDNTPLEWITSELLSQQRRVSTRLSSIFHSPDEHTDFDTSQPTSRPQSRRTSRSPSPDSRHNVFGLSSAGSGSGSGSGNGQRHIGNDPCSSHHRDGHGRNLHGLLRATIRPFTSITHSYWLSRPGSNGESPEQQRQPRQGRQSCPQSRPQSPIRSPVATTTHPLHTHTHTRIHQARSQSQTRSQSRSNTLIDDNDNDNENDDNDDGTSRQRRQRCNSHQLSPSFFFLSRSLTEVPDYDAASRGFMGGLPPLTSLQGLPSYEEVSAMSAPVTLHRVMEGALSEDNGGGGGEHVRAGARAGAGVGEVGGGLGQGQRTRSESHLLSGRMEQMGW